MLVRTPHLRRSRLAILFSTIPNLLMQIKFSENICPRTFFENSQRKKILLKYICRRDLILCKTLLLVLYDPVKM
jgi:hypothetical protein